MNQKLNEYLLITKETDENGNDLFQILGDFLEWKDHTPGYLYGSGDSEIKALKDAVINLNAHMRHMGSRMEFISKKLDQIKSDIVCFDIDPDENYDIEGNPL